MTTNLLSVIEQQQKALEHCVDAIVERGLNGSPDQAEKWGLQLPLERAYAALAAGQQALEQALEQTQGEVERSLYEMLQMCVDENKQLRAQLAGMERLLHFKAVIEVDPPASEPAPLSHLKTETGAPPEQGAITSVNGSEPAPSTAGEQDRESERTAFEADAEPLGFSLLRMANPNVEPWGDYLEMETGMRWGGWLARAALLQSTALPSQGERAEYPDKCPITRRPFFMVIEHPELGMVPTYGGPYDSYTIPHMLGEATQQMHERELEVHRYDHDEGAWVDDETIPLRVIHDDFLPSEDDATPAALPVGELTLEQITRIYDRYGGDMVNCTRAIERELAAARSQPTTEESSVVAGAQPVREPLTDSWILERCAQSWVFETAKQWVRMTEAAHGIKGKP